MVATETQQERICSACSKMLPLGRHEHRPEIILQRGWYCCDEYFCSESCLDASFKDTNETWEQHYSDDGDCYYTEWEGED